MFKAYKYRIYPTNDQKVLIVKHIGSCRFVYNLSLETKTSTYAATKVNLSNFDLIKHLPELKTKFEWLKEVNSQSLQQSITNMDSAFKLFFKAQNAFPKFKKKSDKGSFPVPQSVIVENDLLIIPKFKKGIKIVLHRKIKGIIKSATISKTPTDKYFASILVDTKTEIPKKVPIIESTTVGIDLGIKSFLVASSGIVFENEKHLSKAQSKLKYLSRKFSKYKGKQTKHSLTLAHEKVLNKRRDFLHKTSSELIKNHDSICIEDLNVSGMLKNHCLAQAITDVSWGMFVTMLEYKAEWYGKNILQIGRFDPSSKTCSVCGTINRELTLKVRKWTCKCCNTVLDRDVNASINIKNFALKNHLSEEHTLKNWNELLPLGEVLTSKAHPISYAVSG